MGDPDDIVRRLEDLENVESIKQVKARYVRFVDEKKYEELEALFTPEAKVMSDGATWDSGADLANVVRDFVSAAPAVHRGHMPEIQITDFRFTLSVTLRMRRPRPGRSNNAASTPSPTRNAPAGPVTSCRGLVPALRQACSASKVVLESRMPPELSSAQRASDWTMPSKLSPRAVRA
ncbi:nuclear transport factor 2 family protein [Streptomyces sp. NBC_00827]|nr:nuclear transport factor 2 family protein [Streptomyces sp. NBC_00827]